MEICPGCKDVLIEVKKIEATQDRRYDDYLKRVIEYEVDKAKNTASMKAMHKRLDESTRTQFELNRIVIKHMEEEENHYLEVSKHMSETNQLLKHLATKNDITKVNGRVNTIWIIGPLVLTFFISTTAFFIWYIKEDINLHNTKSSKANYHSIKKVIQKESK